MTRTADSPDGVEPNGFVGQNFSSVSSRQPYLGMNECQSNPPRETLFRKTPSLLHLVVALQLRFCFLLDLDFPSFHHSGLLLKI